MVDEDKDGGEMGREDVFQELGTEEGEATYWRKKVKQIFANKCSLSLMKNEHMSFQHPPYHHYQY